MFINIIDVAVFSAHDEAASVQTEPEVVQESVARKEAGSLTQDGATSCSTDGHLSKECFIGTCMSPKNTTYR